MPQRPAGWRCSKRWPMERKRAGDGPHPQAFSAFSAQRSLNQRRTDTTWRSSGVSGAGQPRRASGSTPHSCSSALRSFAPPPGPACMAPIAGGGGLGFGWGSSVGAGTARWIARWLGGDRACARAASRAVDGERAWSVAASSRRHPARARGRGGDPGIPAIPHLIHQVAAGGQPREPCRMPSPPVWRSAACDPRPHLHADASQARCLRQSVASPIAEQRAPAAPPAPHCWCYRGYTSRACAETISSPPPLREPAASTDPGQLCSCDQPCQPCGGRGDRHGTPASPEPTLHPKQEIPARPPGLQTSRQQCPGISRRRSPTRAGRS